MMKDFDAQRFWNELWLRRRELVFAVILVVVSGLALYFGAWRFWQEIQDVQMDIRAEQKDLNEVQQRVAVINSIDDSQRQLFDQAAIALPIFKEPLLTLQTLDTIAGQTGVSLGEYDINPGIISTESAATSGSRRGGSNRELQTLVFEMELTGDFDEIREALVAIENALPLIDVREISIDPARRGLIEGVDQQQYIASVQLVSFYASLDAAAVVRGGALQLTRQQRDMQEQLLEMNAYRRGGPVQDRDVEVGNQDFFGLQSPPATPVPTAELDQASEPTNEAGDAAAEDATADATTGADDSTDIPLDSPATDDAVSAADAETTTAGETESNTQL